MFVIQSVIRAERCLNNVEVTFLTSTLLQAVCIFSTTLADQAISYSYLKINELYIFLPPHSPLWSSTAGEGGQGRKVFRLQWNNPTRTVNARVRLWKASVSKKKKQKHLSSSKELIRS